MWPNTEFSSLPSTTGPWKLVIDQKWPELAKGRAVVFHQNNARPHTAVVNRQKLQEFGREVLLHPPYSPNLASRAHSPFFSHCKKSVSREYFENG
ncbi:hypothetical protein TNCV_3817091 [Trichonephila clavipes]|nr:hypothetical protein TNCV_3817091 [Trichonephila clavipes]